MKNIRTKLKCANRSTGLLYFGEWFYLLARQTLYKKLKYIYYNKNFNALELHILSEEMT
jgi:hypothetical protein